MIIGCVIHIILWVITLLELLLNGTDYTEESKFCSIAGHLNPDLYMLSNFILALFYFWLIKNAVNQSNSIMTFKNIRDKLFIWLFSPLVFFIFRFLAVKNCKHHSFGLSITFLYFIHISIELSLLFLYFGWYFNEL